VSDPQANDWAGLSWSGWYAFDLAVADDRIPASGGIYWFRSRGEPGLLYIGEGANRRRRLRILELRSKAHPASYYLDWPDGTKRPHRGRYAVPFLRMCRDVGCVVDVSWANDVHADQVDRRAVEARLIRQHRDVGQCDPPWQHGGRGMAAYLARRYPGAPGRGAGLEHHPGRARQHGRRRPPGRPPVLVHARPLAPPRPRGGRTREADRERRRGRGPAVSGRLARTAERPADAAALVAAGSHSKERHLTAIAPNLDAVCVNTIRGLWCRRWIPAMRCSAGIPAVNVAPEWNGRSGQARAASLARSRTSMVL
jgi:hypothetical protein